MTCGWLPYSHSILSQRFLHKMTNSKDAVFQICPHSAKSTCSVFAPAGLRLWGEYPRIPKKCNSESISQQKIADSRWRHDRLRLHGGILEPAFTVKRAQALALSRPRPERERSRDSLRVEFEGGWVPCLRNVKDPRWPTGANRKLAEGPPGRSGRI